MSDITNSIICGDCRDRMRDNIDDESVDLIYMDPPFFSGKNYEIIWKDGTERRSFEDTDFYTLICGNPKCEKIFPENHEFCAFCGTGKDKAVNRRSNDIEAYLQWLRPKLEEAYQNLKPNGSMYIHLDHHAMFNVKVMLDEIFVTGGFKTAITWRRCGSKGNAKTFANNSDYILYYVKGKNFTFNIQYTEYSKATLKMYKYDDHDGRGLYGSYDISAPGRDGYKYDLGYGEKMPPGGYRWKEETMLEKIKNNRVILKRGKVPRQKRYKSDLKGVPFDNVWTDIENVKRPIYPTEKPNSLLRRIILTSSNEGDLILDPFCGCGTAVMVANHLDRKWIGIDVSPKSCKIMVDRLHKEEKVRISERDIINLPREVSELEAMHWSEFQHWVIEQLDGKKNPRKTGDKGVDGWTYKIDKYGMRYGGLDAAIQVKQSHSIGFPEIQKFLGAMQTDSKNTDGKHGIFVAFSFVKTAKSDLDELKAEKGISIEILTVEDLLEINKETK